MVAPFLRSSVFTLALCSDNASVTGSELASRVALEQGDDVEMNSIHQSGRVSGNLIGGSKFRSVVGGQYHQVDASMSVFDIASIVHSHSISYSEAVNAECDSVDSIDGEVDCQMEVLFNAPRESGKRKRKLTTKAQEYIDSMQS